MAEQNELSIISGGSLPHIVFVRTFVCLFVCFALQVHCIHIMISGFVFLWHSYASKHVSLLLYVFLV